MPPSTPTPRAGRACFVRSTPRRGRSIARALLVSETARRTQPTISPDRILNKPRITPAGKNKLRAIVQTAEKLGLGKVKGPVGVATAGLLLTEGLISRSVLAPQVDNEYAKEALRSVGTASVFAATSLIGERMIQNATQKTLPSAASLASINEARLASKKTPRGGVHKLSVQASKGGLATWALKLVGKTALRVATPVVVGVAAAAAFSKSSRAGDSTAVSTTKGGAAALDALAMNIPSSANQALKDRGHGSMPEFISSTVLKAIGQRPSSPPVPTARIKATTRSSSPLARIASAGPSPASAGMSGRVKAHFKQREGKGVFTRAHVRVVPR